MLYIVQVILSGSAEVPQVLRDEAAARAAFVSSARKYWAQSYAAFCERQGVDGAAFSSAQSFVASFDLSDRSRIHLWPVEPDGAPAGREVPLPDLEPLQEQRKQIERLADDLGRAAEAVRGGLAGLAATIDVLTGGASAEPPAADLPRQLAASPPQPAPEAPAAKEYGARERQAYLAAIRNLCVGNRGEYHLCTRHDWRQAVYGNETSLEYGAWVAQTVDQHIEAARQAGYAVLPDPDSPGRYRFRSPGGEMGEVSCEAEGEAWCLAGLHLAGKAESQT